MHDHPRLAALAVVIRGDDVLLVRRRNPPDAGLWGYPGGHVDLGETVQAAAARELLEETGVTATPRQMIDALDIIERDESGAVRFHFLLVAVLCDWVAGVPQAADDVHDAAWVPLSEVVAGRRPSSKDVDRIALAARDILDFKSNT